MKSESAPAAAAAAAAPPTRAPAPDPTPDLFVTAVRPILSARCAPCHEPGGKMYDRLPFDDAAVVASRPQKLLGRLKGEDRKTVEQWLAAYRPPAANAK